MASGRNHEFLEENTNSQCVLEIDLATLENQSPTPGLLVGGEGMGGGGGVTLLTYLIQHMMCTHHRLHLEGQLGYNNETITINNQC